VTQPDVAPLAVPVSRVDPVSRPPTRGAQADPAPSAPAAVREGAGPAAKADAPRRQVPLWALAVGLGLVAAATYFYVPRLYVVETDDAAFQADTISVAPKVAAYVSVLHVTDNTAFAAGQLLVELDPRDFQVAVDSAAASLRSADAAESNAKARLDEQSQIIAADQANLHGDRATLAFASQQLARFQVLAKAGAGSAERWQQAQADIGQKQAEVSKDVAALAAAHTQVAVLQSQVEEAKANVARAHAALARAELNLSYTKIYAETAGTVANRTVQVGDFVQPGQTLFSAVPDEIYVIANFKETQLTHMQVGQPVTITVDAFPGLRLYGHVDSFQHGTGSNFALLPPENATGNFVKIVQRVPVKILLDDPHQNRRLLAPGMSVEAAVTVHKPPRWLTPFL